jgi:hypothetical protein
VQNIKIKKIAIIGAGWFGCHIANELKKEKYKITIFEREDDIFKNGSGNNTNRLHLGYHYPRSKVTRKMSFDGYQKFINTYPRFSKPLKKNIYAIAKDKSNMMTSKTFENSIKQSKLKLSNISLNNIDLINITKAYNTNERQIDHKKAKNFFKKKLKQNLLFKKNIKVIKEINKKFIIDNKTFDYVVNCTWQQSFKSNDFDLTYEHCLISLFKSKNKKHFSYTIMDGPFYTLLEWSKNVFALYSVKQSRVLTSKNLQKVKKSYNTFSIRKEHKVKIKIEDGFLKFYPNFKKNFTFIKNLKSIRTIIKNKKDARICVVKNNNNFINILSGKIDHIFYAYEQVLKYIKKNNN